MRIYVIFNNVKARVLWPHQEKMLAYCQRESHPALFCDMRTGKTLVTLHAIKAENQILIIAPLSAFESWERDVDFLKSDHLLIPLIGTKAERQYLLHENISCNRIIFLLNWEGIFVLPETAKITWDAVILDESTRLKDVKTKTSKYFTEHFRNVRRRFILTGAPAPESKLDYYQQLKFLDGKAFGSENFYHFRHRNFRPFYGDWRVTDSGLKRIKETLARRVLFISRQNVRKQGHEKIYERRYCDLLPDFREMYDTLKKEFILEFKNKPINKTLYATTKFIWLRQIIGGIISTAPSKHKLDLLSELFQNELYGQRVIIWAVFTEEIKAIVEFLITINIPSYAITGQVKPAERKSLEQLFRKLPGSVLVIQPECYKFGADLSSADTMIYFSTPTSGMTRRQTEDRGIHLYRKNPLLIIDLLCRKTIDEAILENTLAKISDFEGLRKIIQQLQND